MALKGIVKDLNSVAEELRSLYKKHEDGTYRLDAEGIEFEEDTAGLKSAFEKTKRELKQTKDKYGDVDPDEYARLRADADKADAEKAKAEGNWESLKTQLQEKHDQETKKLQDENVKLRGSVEKALVDSVAATAIAKAKGSATLLMPHVKSRVKIVEESGEFIPQVVDAKGNPMIGDAKGNPMSIDQLIESLKSDKDYQAAFEPSGSSGSGADPNQQKGSVASGATVSRMDGDAIAANAGKIVSGEVTAV